MIGSEVPWIWITDGGFGGLQEPSWVADTAPTAANTPVWQASARAITPPLLMPAAYTRAGSIGTLAPISRTTPVRKPMSSTFCLPALPQQPAVVFHDFETPSG